MTLQAASLGRVALGPQASKGTAALDASFVPYKANLVGLNASQTLTRIGQLVGGSLVSGGAIKTAAWGGGALVMPPALAGNLGWLLYAFAGSVSSVDNTDGTYSHVFPAGADTAAVDKYLTSRKKVPGSTALYEQITDLRPFRMLFGVTPGQYANFRAELIGREPSNPDGAAWDFETGLEAPETSTPVSANGTFNLAGSPINTTNGVQLDMVNAVPGLQRVMVNGSLYPYDFPVLERVVTVSFNFLWENPDLYKQIFYGSTAAIEPLVYSSAYDLTVQSAGMITGVLPYELKFEAANVDWEASPVDLRGGDLVEMAVSGTLKAAVSGYDWRLTLTNDVAAYTWPV